MVPPMFNVPVLVTVLPTVSSVKSLVTVAVPVLSKEPVSLVTVSEPVPNSPSLLNAPAPISVAPVTVRSPSGVTERVPPFTVSAFAVELPAISTVPSVSSPSVTLNVPPFEIFRSDLIVAVPAFRTSPAPTVCVSVEFRISASFAVTVTGASNTKYPLVALPPSSTVIVSKV